MHEQTKALPRRKANPEYQRYFAGFGLDIGSGPDPLINSRHNFPGMISAKPWDKEMGDGATLPGEVDQAYDFVFASHLLEHLEYPEAAVNRWISVTKILGYLIITIPDWEMYERRQWPSKFSGEHKWAFTMQYGEYLPQVIWLPQFLRRFESRTIIERLQVIRDGFDPTLPTHVDQTMGKAECAIEFVLRRTH